VLHTPIRKIIFEYDNMNVRYFLLASTLLLAACGPETEVQVASSEQARPVTTTGSDSTQEQLNTPDTQAVVSEQAVNPVVETAESSAETDRPVEVAVSAPEQSGPLLPLGRLIGIVDGDDYKQATINNQGKVIRLREGDDWQGWKVEAIGQKKVVISQNNAQHSLLLLSEFRAPEPTQNLSDSQQMAQRLSNDEAAGGVAPQFTEEQLAELRSRLLMGRPAQQ
jgi:hypothetical protein